MGRGGFVWSVAFIRFVITYAPQTSPAARRFLHCIVLRGSSLTFKLFAILVLRLLFSFFQKWQSGSGAQSGGRSQRNRTLPRGLHHRLVLSSMKGCCVRLYDLCMFGLESETSFGKRNLRVLII